MYEDLVKQLRDNAEFLVKASSGCLSNSFADTMCQAADAIEEMSKSRWIPVTEQLPEVGQRIMAVGLHREAMFIGTYNGGIKETEYRKAKPYKMTAHGYGWRTFTYWMPLPEPPKEEAGQDAGDGP